MMTHYKNPGIYIAVTYIVFWLGILLTGGIYLLLLKNNLEKRCRKW